MFHPDLSGNSPPVPLFPRVFAVPPTSLWVSTPFIVSLSSFLPMLRPSHILLYYPTTCHSFNVPHFTTLDVFPSHVYPHHSLFPYQAMPKCQPLLLSHDPDGSWDHVTSFVGWIPILTLVGNQTWSVRRHFCIYSSPFPWGFSLA